MYDSQKLYMITSKSSKQYARNNKENTHTTLVVFLPSKIHTRLTLQEQSMSNRSYKNSMSFLPICTLKKLLKGFRVILIVIIISCLHHHNKKHSDIKKSRLKKYQTLQHLKH